MDLKFKIKKIGLREDDRTFGDEMFVLLENNVVILFTFGEIMVEDLLNPKLTFTRVGQWVNNKVFRGDKKKIQKKLGMKLDSEEFQQFVDDLRDELLKSPF